MFVWAQRFLAKGAGLNDLHGGGNARLGLALLRNRQQSLLQRAGVIAQRRRLLVV